MILFPKYARTIIAIRQNLVSLLRKCIRYLVFYFSLSSKINFICRASFCIVGENHFFCKYQEHNSTYSSRKKIKIGRLPDDEAKEKKQVKFHAGEVCYLRPM